MEEEKALCLPEDLLSPAGCFTVREETGSGQLCKPGESSPRTQALWTLAHGTCYNVRKFCSILFSCPNYSILLKQSKQINDRYILF